MRGHHSFTLKKPPKFTLLSESVQVSEDQYNLELPDAILLPRIYSELRRLAAARLALEPKGQTLQPTALVHEVYLRLARNQQEWDSPGHFFASAAIAMQRILVDYGRRKNSTKRGGDLRRVELSDVPDTNRDTLSELVSALNDLAAMDPVASQVVDLHHFAGLTQSQTAEELGTTEYQVRQKWKYARAILKSALEG